jgi:maltooligosyltrehalose trehalohydrolase
MLWMGDEYGEQAPFQFFTDHIDEEIAVATREGRRREFRFVDDVPDPQDPATFERSKLTRRRDAGLEQLHRDLIAARRDLPAGDAEVTFDEEERWLRVRRGDRTLVANFSDQPLPLDADPIVSTHPLQDGALPPLAGALVR